MVLGSTAGSFTMGPPDRFLELVGTEQEANLCLVHRASCQFWPAFCATYDSSENLFVQLAEATGHRTIVINNAIPDGVGAHLEDPRVDDRELIAVRDGRAVVASYLRKFPDAGPSGAIDWYAPAAEAMAALQRSAGIPVLRYEDLIDDPASALAELRLRLSIPLTVDSLRYFEHEHHPVAGNQGTLHLLHRHQGLPAADFEDSDWYRDMFEGGVEQMGDTIRDVRWRDELSAKDLEAFEDRCGEVNRSFGY